jgi:hypothetical protein
VREDVIGILARGPIPGVPACQVWSLTPKKANKSNDEKPGQDINQNGHFGKTKHYSPSSEY